MGIEVLPPDVNESLANFTVIDDKHIRFGLNAIKNLGSDVIEAVIKARKEGGKFTSLEDMVTRLLTRNFNKKSWEALVKSGAMDAFGERGTLLANSEMILDFTRSFMKDLNSTQSSLFGTSKTTTAKLKLREVEPVTKKDKLSWEKELLGLYVSAHPLDEYGSLLSKVSQPIKSISSAKGTITLGGIITKIQKILTKKGDQMAFIDVEDLTGIVEVLVFPTLFQKVKDLLTSERIVLLTGKVSDKDGVPKFLADDIKDLSEMINNVKQSQTPIQQQSTINVVNIDIPQNAREEIFIELKKLFEAYPGEQPVNLIVNKTQVKTPFRISLNNELRSKITELLK
jgi:DNA polymerase III subunit alpha